SGLDPANSRMMKNMILEEKAKGKTILLTTHNMQDAAELCDRVAFIVNGKICALDSPHNLIMSKGAATVTYTWIDDGEHSASCPLEQISSDERLKKLIAENHLQSIHSSEPTLNDIFMDITGRTLL
ncbi:ABC transporter ATP-binding protein, partial [Lachnospiraceae bacterium 29-91]